MSIIDDLKAHLGKFVAELSGSDELLGEGFSNHDRGQVLESANKLAVELGRVPDATPAAEVPVEAAETPAT